MQKARRNTHTKMGTTAGTTRLSGAWSVIFRTLTYVHDGDSVPEGLLTVFP